MSQENAELVRRYYGAWNAGGLEAVRAFWSDDFEWDDAPALPDGGVYRGTDAAAAHLRDLGEVLGDMEVEIEGLAPAGDEVFVRLRVHLGAPRGGLLLDGPIFETVHIEQGKVSRIRLFVNEAEALEAAGLRE
jgi:uncharacterized protein